MRIGFDVSPVRHGLNSGVAVYTARLARALLELPERPNLTAYFCARSSPGAEAVLRELRTLGAEIVRGPAPWRWSPDGAWWLAGGPPLGRLLDRVDVFHAGEFHLPRRTDTPWVATVHDLTTLTHSEHHFLLNRWLHRHRLRRIRRGASRIIAVSQHTGRELGRVLGVGPERVTVVHEALGHDTTRSARDAADVRRRHGLHRPYVLSVGTLEPRKNHERLVKAFEQVAGGCGAAHGDLHLVLAGGDGWRARRIRRVVATSPARSRIRVLGRVPSGDLPALYAGATLFAYPSLYEGFGLPVLEAMASGTPVLTSDISSLPEVAGDAALLVDPHSIDAIRGGIQRLLDNEGLRGRLARRGREREKQFTWRRTAKETMAVYRQVVSAEGTGRKDD